MFTLLLGNMGSVFAASNGFTDSQAMRITLNDSETKEIIGGEEIFLNSVRVHVAESGKFGWTGIHGATVSIEYIDAESYFNAGSGTTFLGNFVYFTIGQRLKKGKIRVSVNHKGKVQVQERNLGGIRHLHFNFKF